MSEAERASRVNAAAELLAAGVPVGDAVGLLAGRFAVSTRQARRYLQDAGAGPVAVPEAGSVFTVRLPASLVARVRQHAARSNSTISAVVATALGEFLTRHHTGQTAEQPVEQRPEQQADPDRRRGAGSRRRGGSGR